eukprot:Nitzschia sp. Nitz4//scaffold19_size178191//168714//171518//NITZ4_002014-RA/size178191-augustus-gene-0.86-mRNA-1//1//CDS//3329540792//3969//frame0
MAPADSNPQAGQGRPLPKRESDLFKNVVKHYETKQYKKALKQADTILKKFPNHGETLAMKGLILNCMSKNEEAHALVRQGLVNDMSSHVCWHVCGLLHRADRDYAKAIQAYKQALRIDAENLQILRDLSMLQVQMRDLEGFALTRHNILTLKPNGKINWLAFALAKHLNGDNRGAISVIDIYLGTLTDGAPELSRGFEASELAMYRNRILSEIPDNYQEALDHLKTCENLVVDRTNWLLTRAYYILKLGDFEAAREAILEIFERGLTENFKVHSMYMCALLELNGSECDEAMKLCGTRSLASWLPMSEEQKQIILDAYKDILFPKYSRSAAVQRIPMDLVDAGRFKNSMDIFLRKGIVKGVPSLCYELKTFMTIEHNGKYKLADDPLEIRSHATYRLLVEMVDGYIACLKENNKLLPTDEEEEPPSSALWAWYLRAGLHELAAEYKEAIEWVDKCLEHTPTAVDAYELKARLLKGSGDMKAAVECLDTGRDLDKQDRYINNQTTQYMLDAGMEKEALDTISLFTKHEGNPEANLYEMQCSWYELGLAANYARKKEFGKSLKKYTAVVKHFDDFQEDQFDFHAYCVRKVTLRAYTEVLKYEDEVRGESYYFRAAEGIIKIYLHLHDNPSILSEDEEPDYSKMTAAQRKKAKSIARKKRQQKEKAVEKEKEEAKEETTGKPSFVTVDPDGKELLKLDALEEAKKYSSILSKHCPTQAGTWVLQYDVAVRRKKWLLALQALFKLRAMDALSGDFVSRVVDFASRMASFEASGAVKKVLDEEFPNLLNGKATVEEFLKAGAETVRSDASCVLAYRVAVAKGLVDCKLESASAAAALVTKGGLDGKGVSVDACRDALTTLKAVGDKAACEEWIALVKAKFPLVQGLS